MQPPETEDWLAPFADRLKQAGPRVLEVGCGPGLDAAYLGSRGFDVVGLDRSRPGWAAQPDPATAFVRADLRHPPIRRGAFDVVLASLSLHYLPWDQTRAAFASAGACLRSDGLFLFRVNASDDYHHGAGQGEELEPGFFRVPTWAAGWTDTKRFFTESDVRAAIPAGFAIEHLVHSTIHRYAQPKRVWECLARRVE